VALEILVRAEPLDGLCGKIAVWHWVADSDWLEAGVAEQLGDIARCLGLATASPDCDDGDDWLGALEPCVLWAKEAKVCACGHDAVGDVHDCLVVEI